jgi:hypothetical protein
VKLVSVLEAINCEVAAPGVIANLFAAWAVTICPKPNISASSTISNPWKQ